MAFPFSRTVKNLSQSIKRKREPEEAIRAELFSIERLEQHAKSLALSQRLSKTRSGGPRLLPRVKQNAHRLTQGYRRIARTIREGLTITPASEWLVDNFHIIEDQVREIIDDLPPGYYQGLPKLEDGFLKGTPRIYGIAWAFVAHTDSRIDPEWLRRFLKAYQKHNSLSIGEIWAFSISLRIVLVENLRRLMDQIISSGNDRKKADALADALLGLSKKFPQEPSGLLRAYEELPLQKSFSVQLVQRLRDQGKDMAPILQWLDLRLESQGADAEKIVRLEHQEQTAMNTTARNAITSMRLLSALDWRQFFEDVSSVDEILRLGSNFDAMDFPTRDQYRNAIEDLSLGSGLSEVEVTSRAIARAGAFRSPQKRVSKSERIEMERRRDPGYYLISKGRPQFEKDINYRLSLKRRAERIFVKWATPLFLGTAALLSAVFIGIPLYVSALDGITLMGLIVFGLMGFVPASNLAVDLINLFIMDCMKPEHLPKLDFSSGIPKKNQTLIVMPTLLSSQEAVKEHIGRLEIHHLSNPDGHLQYALLTDWVDAPQERAASDSALLKTGREAIEKLNNQYGKTPGDRQRFFIFHRKRLWNAQEGAWMGWERKRGKIRELNRLLRGSQNTSFIDVDEAPSGIQYVITLDADTHIPRGSIHRLVGAMAHPLNRPQLDARLKRVVEGYGVMQPRITPTLPAAGFDSHYQKFYSGSAGIDPYAFAVSDVYQDLFKEGSYTGKGIYDVDVFEAALDDRVPENLMLSHDLFEGLYARAALLTDVTFFEAFPSHYAEAVARNHRWVRGDWQLLPWILRRKNSLSFIGRWKMIDNLRRSLSNPAAFLTLVFSWTLKDALTGMWVGFVLTTISLPALLPVLVGFLPRRRHISIANHLRGLWSDFKLAMSRIFLSLVFMAHQTWVMSDAILRTLYRLIVSRRRLLEWTSAALSKNIFNNELSAFIERQKSAIFLSALVLTLILFFDTHVLWWSILPFIFLWVLSPWVAQLVSLPLKEDKIRLLSAEDHQYLRIIARKTWAFFETTVTSEHHFLPPDNFQEIPQPVVAHRTSPTNIGLYLLSTLAARDFGWIGVSETVERLENTMATVKNLKRYKGHLFNWYDTKELRPLEPLYVSTVDSGNLAGHLWTTQNACHELMEGPLFRENILNGFEDTLLIIKEAATKGMIEDRRTEIVTRTHFQETLAGLSLALQNFRFKKIDWSANLNDLKEKTETLIDIAETLMINQPGTPKNNLLKWTKHLLYQVNSHVRDSDLRTETGDLALPLKSRLRSLADLCRATVSEMQFGFLFDPSKKIFSIGFLLNEDKLDNSYYDLLASEARLASFVAIAKGDVPAEHWFHLSRSFRLVQNGIALLSWSGSMFEYLMPSLVMRVPIHSILDQTDRQIVHRQVAYGRQRKVPWGISESAYNVQDIEFTYQYSNFGVPGLGLKRGLSDDLVIAPYATALAAMVDPLAAAKNFKKLENSGAGGEYGFYESIDYTPERLPKNQNASLVQAYMAHHQAMSLVALTNVLYAGVMRARFHAEPMVQATELLLQEKMPRNAEIAQTRPEELDGEARPLVPMVWRRFHSPQGIIPHTHLLSNGHMSVMLTAAGSGFSKVGHNAITRFREDVTRDNWGAFIYLRDMGSGKLWSAGYQPTGADPDYYEVDFSDERAEIVRQDGSLLTTLEVVVSPEDDAEIRRVTIKNSGVFSREIEVTSYAEIVLASQAADQSHPAFSNLFVQTEFVPSVNGLICSRRLRSPEETPLWMAHVVVVEGTTIGEIQYESDRSQFLGRGHSIHAPLSITDGKPLSNTVGSVLDPIVSLRRRIRINSGKTARLAFATLTSPTREGALELADKYHDPAMFERTVTQAWTHAHIQHHHLGMALAEAHIFQNLASRIIYSRRGRHPSQDILKQNNKGARGLWARGISGDIPIVLLRINESDDLGIVHELLRAHEYWRMKNLAVDLIILNERVSSYVQDLQTALENLIRTTQTFQRHSTHPSHGDIFILRLDQISTEDHILLRSAARVTLLSQQGTLAEQVGRMERALDEPLSPRPQQPLKPVGELKTSIEKLNLRFFNGLGGFSEDGKEYVTMLKPGQWTPAPWINVISNPDFGFNVSESGSGHTWSLNSRENKITPWSNDPVCDPPGEVLYIRDEESGEVWTPTAQPIREETSSYISRHGQGYSRFQHMSHELLTDLIQFVPQEDSIKISRLRLTNNSGRTRRLSITAYVEWVLGTSRSISNPFIITELDEKTGAMLARNPWNNEFSSRFAFADLDGKQKRWTGDRTEFLGRNGTPDRPRALEPGTILSNKVGAGLDACAALQTDLIIRPGQTAEVVFTLGDAASRDEAVDLIQRARATGLDESLLAIKKQWDDILSSVQIRTPDLSMNILMNRWLLYQTVACRMWSRAGFYQAGGAYGFRDQLQDAMALVVSRRDLAREQILRAASRQFPEGDVQHWWHPPTGRGVRTKISDDLIWLPYTLNHYLEVTGDTEILDEKVPFLSGESIPEGKEEVYFQPEESPESATLFEHCARALDRSLVVGIHGLPLMGSGDWNDGMNRIGHEGKGESVWMAWLLHASLWEFARLAQSRGEFERAERWRIHVGELKTAVERHGWDGEWYRRAFFDDGTPVGSNINTECKIDSLAQSWGVISGAADPARASKSMASVNKYLIHPEENLVRIFTPPFNTSVPNPGYIQGYLPGVRENGGQYTHAAIWTLIAFAELGEGNKAGELFSLLNPINRGKSRADIQRYKVEPYVMAADVYAEFPHVGRGGWTWYTGSAGWMYRAGLEWILGFRLRDKKLFIDPCIPSSWPSFEISFQHLSSRYEIKVENPKSVSRGVHSTLMDGKLIGATEGVPLIDDGGVHIIRVVLG